MEISVLGHKMRLEIVILSMIVGGFISLNMFCSCAGGVKEGFQTGTKLLGAGLDYSMGKGVSVSWETTEPKNSGDYEHLDTNHGGPVPLPEGQLYMF